MGQEEHQLWIEYESGSESARRGLLDLYIGLVHSIARQLSRRLPAGVELEDLVGAGTLGLVLALERFDRERGLAFSTYATPRIRGAILDDLRRRDWVPRSVRSKARRMGFARSLLGNALQRAPTSDEVSRVLGVGPRTVARWQEQVDGAVLMSLDATTSPGELGAATLKEIIPDPDARSFESEVMQQESVELLKESIAALPAKEATVLALYYYEELNLRQIAGVMHLTESRISQIRTGALARLRAVIEGDDVLRSAADVPAPREAMLMAV